MTHIEKIAKEFEEKLKSYPNKRQFDVNIENDNIISVDISNGDWKHEHLFVDLVAKELSKQFEFKFEDIYESDGSDCYSAIHKYVYTIEGKPLNLELIK